MPDISDYDRQALIESANRLRIDPRTLAAVIDYESGFNPRNSNPSGRGYPVRGLIGFDPENVRRYGAPASTIAAQMPQVENYLLDRGWKPGTFKPNDLPRLYSIINAGSLNKWDAPRWNARDINGFLADHVRNIQSGHMRAADRFLAPVMNQEDLVSEWGSKPGGAARAGRPSGAGAAPAADEDLVSEWGTPSKGAPADVATPPPTPSPIATAAAEHETIPQFLNRVTAGARGHGDQNVTGLVTGAPRGDSWGDLGIRIAAGLGRGVGDVGDTLAQGITAAGGTVADLLARHGYISPERAKSIADWRAGVNADIARQNAEYEAAQPGVAGNLARIGGEIAGSAPFLSAAGGALRALPGAGAVTGFAARHPILASVGTGAGVGAGTNLLTSARDEDTSPLAQAAWGGATGAALGPVGYGIGRMLGRGAAVDQETGDLARLAMDKYGIPLRADQISGNEMIKRGGALLQKTPGSGMAANTEAQQAALNRGVAATFGENSDKVTQGVWQRAKDRIGNVFDTELPNLEAFTNPNLMDRLNRVMDAADRLPEDERRVVHLHVKDIFDAFTNTKVGGATVAKPPLMTRAGVPYQQMDGRKLQGLIASGSPLDMAINSDRSSVAHLASNLKNILLDAVRETPTGRAKTAAGYVQSLRNFENARFQYKNLKTVEPLVAKAPTGDISPAQLQGAVSRGFSNVAGGGGGDLAELARIGQRFLKPPGSSGTAEHLALMEGAKYGAAALGLGGVAGDVVFNPEHAQRDLLTLGGLMAASRAGGGILRSRSLANASLGRGWLSLPQRARAGEALSYTAPAALAARSNPLVLTVHPDSPGP